MNIALSLESNLYSVAHSSTPWQTIRAANAGAGSILEKWNRVSLSVSPLKLRWSSTAWATHRTGTSHWSSRVLPLRNDEFGWRLRCALRLYWIRRLLSRECGPVESSRGCNLDRSGTHRRGYIASGRNGWRWSTTCDRALGLDTWRQLRWLRLGLLGHCWFCRNAVCLLQHRRRRCRLIDIGLRLDRCYRRRGFLWLNGRGYCDILWFYLWR